ncbi:hypothetical protein AQPE_1498 [Aquipluma nitroreducens]|uniref:Uncharacterized protein n=1 Tax=Aquipluma nitroreducens TaxID=2010828 RepID=A0A5K7S710_9BACT|nr:hypothetical protein AQPE_1498 [Aquipluma nitroreducens]
MATICLPKLYTNPFCRVFLLSPETKGSVTFIRNGFIDKYELGHV